MVQPDAPFELVADACTLPTAEQPLRLAEFDEVFRTRLVSIVVRDDQRLRLGLRGGPGTLSRVRDLAARETACCSFFTMRVEADGEDRIAWEIEVPAQRRDVLAALAERAAELSGVMR